VSADWEVVCTVCGTLIPENQVASYVNRKGESRVRWHCPSCGATGYETVSGNFTSVDVVVKDQGEKDNDGSTKD
jgi:RNase P subunit RPR2